MCIFALFGAKGSILPRARRACVSWFRFGRATFRIEPDRSVSACSDEHAQKAGALRTRVWEPLCVSALNTPVERASAQVFATCCATASPAREQRAICLVARTDFGRLFPEPAAEYVKARGGAISLGVSGAPHRTRAGRIPPQRCLDFLRRCDRLRAAPSWAAACNCPRSTKPFRVNAFEYEPIVTCYLQYPESVSLPVPMLGFSGGIAQWVFDRGRLGGPKGLLRP